MAAARLWSIMPSFLLDCDSRQLWSAIDATMAAFWSGSIMPPLILKCSSVQLRPGRVGSHAGIVSLLLKAKLQRCSIYVCFSHCTQSENVDDLASDALDASDVQIWILKHGPLLSILQLQMHVLVMRSADLGVGDVFADMTGKSFGSRSGNRILCVLQSRLGMHLVFVRLTNCSSWDASSLHAFVAVSLSLVVSVRWVALRTWSLDPRTAPIQVCQHWKRQLAQNYNNL